MQTDERQSQREPEQTAFFSLEDFVLPTANRVIQSRTVTVKKHTRTIIPGAQRNALPKTVVAPDKLTKKSTLQQARAWLDNHVEDGVKCPVCTRFAKVYRRTITANMARALILMYLHDKEHAGEFVHVDKFLMTKGVHSGGAMPALLRHWDLVERQKGRRKDGSTAIGRYRITERGKLFVENRCTVERYVRLFDDRALFIADESKMSIIDALKKQFNYLELMQRG